MIKIAQLTKSFGERKVLDHIDLEIESHTRTVIFGPSGSGKSTLLRLIAGLEKASAGSIDLNGARVTMVFQDDYLLEHLSAFENIALGLDRRVYSKEEIEERVQQIAQLTQTKTYLDRPISKLSGGERQRIAIARALVSKPDLVLLDEAFNHLDPRLKKKLLLELIEWQKTLRITLICVSHEFMEASFLAEQLIVLDHGKILQIGKPQDVFDHPDSLFVADSLDLIGMNEVVLDGRKMGIRPGDCSFGPKEDWIRYGIFHPDDHVSIGGKILWIGSVDGKPFSIWSQKKEVPQDTSVYIDRNKIVSFED